MLLCYVTLHYIIYCKNIIYIIYCKNQLWILNLCFTCTFQSKPLVVQVVQKMLTDPSTNSCSSSTKTSPRKDERVTAGRQEKPPEATQAQTLMVMENSETKSSWNVFQATFHSEDGENCWKHYLKSWLTQENLKEAWFHLVTWSHGGWKMPFPGFRRPLRVILK